MIFCAQYDITSSKIFCFVKRVFISLIFLLFVTVFYIFFRGQDHFCPSRCLSFADNWLRLQCCVVVVNANPVSGDDAKLEDYVSSVLLKVSARFQIKDTRFSRLFQDLTQELDTRLSYQPAAASYPGLFMLSELPEEA